MTSDLYEIDEPTPDHHFRTEIPNIVFELGLDLYSLQLYIHLKKIAGDCGSSIRSIRSLSRLCQMSETKVKESLKILQCKFAILGCPLIESVARFKEDGSPDSNYVTIVSIWRKNGDIFREKSKNGKKTGGWVATRRGGGGSPHDGGVGRHTPGGGSPHDHKEEPLQEEPLKEELLLGEAPPVFKKNECKKKEQATLVVSDVHAYCVRSRLDWSVEEIEEAFASFTKCESPVSDPYQYIRGIVRNKRNLANIRRQKEKSRSGAPRSKSKPLPKRMEEPQPKESPPSPERPWDNDPRLHPLYEHFSYSEKKAIHEASLQKINH